MFEELEVLAARLRASAPAQDDPCTPTLDPAGTLVEELLALARVIAAAQAQTMVIQAALYGQAETWQHQHDPDRSARVGPDDLVAAEIGPALHLTPKTAALHVERATQIVTRLPLTLAAFRRGDLDLGRVLTIWDATLLLSDEDAGRVERVVLGKAVDQNAAELRRSLAKAVIAIDPDAAERRRKAAVKERGVYRYQAKDGTSHLDAVLSAYDTGEIYDLIDGLARDTKLPGDTRTMDARRADALVFLLTGHDPNLGPQDDDPADPGPDDPGPHEPGPHEPAPEPADDETVADSPADPFRPDPDDPGPTEPADLDQPDYSDDQLVGRVSDLTALMIAALTRRRAPRLPWVTITGTIGPDGAIVEVGELQAYGPVTAEYARHFLDTGAARAPDPPSGREPTPEQARIHDPPQWLANDVKARDRTCRYPGCTRPVHQGDLDHTVAHAKGGLTVRTNLGGLCRRHHRVKESGAWTVRQYGEGIYEWTSKITGRTYTTYPRGHTGEWRGATS